MTSSLSGSRGQAAGQHISNTTKPFAGTRLTAKYNFLLPIPHLLLEDIT